MRLTGQVRVQRADGAVAEIRGKQAQIVLALLAVERRAVLREEIADLLWGDAPLPDHWPNAVRIVLSKIRAGLAALGLPGTVVLSTEGRVRLDLPGGWDTDLDLARQLVLDAEAAGQDRAQQAAGWGRAAEELLTGPLPPGFDGPWAERLAESRQHLVGRAFRVQARSEIALGDHAAAAATALTRLAVDPLDEAAHHLVIQALLADGRTAAAWRAFARLTEVLSSELGVAPSPATRALLETPSPQPSTPRPTPGRLMLGRTEPLDRLDDLWSTVLDSGRPGLAVIEGPTGIGKTRLIREAAKRISTSGGQILWGTCHPGSGLPYEPLLGALGERLAAADRRTDDPTPGPALAPLLGFVDPPPEDTDLTSPNAARAAVFRDLFALTRALLVRPTMWVVDDLQWASEDTAAFLDLVVADLAAPLLLVVITRNTPPGVADALARWQKSAPAVLSLPLTPLTAIDLEPLVATLPVVDLPVDRVAIALHERTGGHPFYVSEVAREARRQGRLDLAVIPAGVRDWIRHRITALPAGPARLLDLAAVIGERVPVGLLARCSPEPLDDVLTLLELLTEQGFLAETTDGFAFPHRITPEVVYDRIGLHRRALLHGTVAAAVEESAADDPSLIAHHLARSGPESRGRAVPFAVLAAERNLAVGAWALAESELAAVADFAAPPVDQATAAVALGLSLHQQGRVDEAQQALEQAIEVSRRHGLAPELAAGALKMVGRGGRGAAGRMSDDDRVALLREAGTALIDRPLRDDDRDTPAARDLLRVRIEGELGWALLFSGTRAERAALALAGLHRLDSTDDPSPELIGQAVVNARSVRTAGTDLAVRQDETRRALDLPVDQISADVRLAVLVADHEDAVRAQDRHQSVRTLATAGHEAHQTRYRYWQWAAATWSSLDLAMQGDLDRAEAALAAATVTYAGTAPEVEACYAVQLVCLRLLAGRGAEILPLIAGAADLNPHIPCYRAVLALTAVEIGDRATATSALDLCARDGFDAVPDDSNRFLALGVLGDVVASLGRVDHATTLIDALLPWSGQQILLNCYGGGGATWGPVDRVLGRLGRLTGDNRADDWFAAALRQAEGFGFAWAAARVRRDLADRP